MNASRTGSTKDTYCTPANILDAARRLRGPFALDPATNVYNPTAAQFFCLAPGGYVPSDGRGFVDGLAQDWADLVDRAGGGSVWLNPPFLAKLPFLTKCAIEYARGCEIQAIIPCDPATVWFQRHCSPRLSAARAVCYLRSRPVFLNPETMKPPTDAQGRPAGAMFGCAVVYWGPDPDLFREVWSDLGDVDLGDLR